jgi:predicted SPOUT superfamily RNA methylase MTH1
VKDANFVIYPEKHDTNTPKNMILTYKVAVIQKSNVILNINKVILLHDINLNIDA